MGTGRKFHKKPATRPIKSAAERRSRDKVQRARLVKIGFDETAVHKMNIDEVKSLINRYARKSTRQSVLALIRK